MFDDIFENNEVTEDLMFEVASERFADQLSKQLGSIAVMSWVQTGDPSADALMEVLDLTSGFTEEEEIMEESDSELHSDVAAAVCEAMERFGVDFDTCEAAVNGNEDAVRVAFNTIRKTIDESAMSIEDMMVQYTLGSTVREASANYHKSKADWRIDRKKRLKRKRRPKKRLTAAQKMALRKNLRKARRGFNVKMAQKTKAKRAKQGFY